MVNFDPASDSKAKENLDALWDKLSQGGKILMPLQEYPFSKHYGWIEDKFGVSWQVVPRRLGELLSDLKDEKSKRALNAMLEMQKLDVSALEAAYEGK